MNDKILKVLPEQDAMFKVKIGGTPRPEVQWFVDGTLVKPTKNIKPTIENEFATLTIRKVVPEDENTYTIVVRNDHGEVREDVSLVVISKISCTYN